MKIHRIASLILLASLALAVGCRTSGSYKFGVESIYPPMADRLDRYSEKDTNAAPAAAALRTAAESPITYEAASDAWQLAAPVYRQNVAADTELPEFRRTQWLKTADISDELNRKEGDRRALFFLPR